jgi:vitamin B12 transporter
VTYFRTEIENLISGSGTTAVNLSGTSKTEGLEVSGRWRPYEPLSLSVSYTYTNGADANGTELIRRPRHIASINASYDFTHSGAPVKVNLGADYHGRRNDLAFDAFFNTSTVTLGSYTLVNLAASWQPREGVELYARLENALDEDYEDILSYGAPGRSVFAGARLRF